jgi:hypothetical protein
MTPGGGAVGALDGALDMPSAVTGGTGAASAGPAGGGGAVSAPKGITIAEIEATGGPMRQALIFKYMQENGIPFVPISDSQGSASSDGRRISSTDLKNLLGRA